MGFTPRDLTHHIAVWTLCGCLCYGKLADQPALHFYAEPKPQGSGWEAVTVMDRRRHRIEDDSYDEDALMHEWQGSTDQPRVKWQVEPNDDGELAVDDDDDDRDSL